MLGFVVENFGNDRMINMRIRCRMVGGTCIHSKECSKIFRIVAANILLMLVEADGYTMGWRNGWLIQWFTRNR